MASKRMVEDVSTEILLQLPVKSLMRFKSLSKFYGALIRDHCFIHRHFQCSSKNPWLLTFHYQFARPLKPSMSLFSDESSRSPIELGLPNPQTLQARLDLGLPFAESSQPPVDTCLRFPNILQPSINLELPFPDKQVSRLVPWGLCNGIFCVYVTYLNSPDDLILWNPATREVKVLPLPNHLRSVMKICKHGFGVDPETNDYKVVCIWMAKELPNHLRETNLPLVEVYSLKSNSWKKINVTLPASKLRSSVLNSYLNGVYHWLSSEGIICFDMSNEVFWKIKLPEVFPDRREIVLNCDVTVCNDCIAYVLEYGIVQRLFRRIESHRIEIWVMNKHGVEESWTKRFSIGPQPGLRKFRGFWKDGEILTAHDINGRLVSYNLETQQPVMEFAVPDSASYLETTEEIHVAEEDQQFLQKNYSLATSLNAIMTPNPILEIMAASEDTLQNGEVANYHIAFNTPVQSSDNLICEQDMEGILNDLTMNEIHIPTMVACESNPEEELGRIVVGPNLLDEESGPNTLPHYGPVDLGSPLLNRNQDLPNATLEEWATIMNKNIFQLSLRVARMYEDSFSEWHLYPKLSSWQEVPNLPSQQSNLYHWATTGLKDNEGLALVIQAKENCRLTWDLCQVSLHTTNRIIYFNHFLLAIPSSKGPFLISPLNWFFSFQLWNQFMTSSITNKYICMREEVIMFKERSLLEDTREENQRNKRKNSWGTSSEVKSILKKRKTTSMTSLLQKRVRFQSDVVFKQSTSRPKRRRKFSAEILKIMGELEASPLRPPLEQ